MIHIRFYRQILLALVFLGSFSGGFAQVRPPFSENPTEFIKEIRAFLEASDQQNYKAIAKQFAATYATYDATRQATTIAQCNAMLRQRMNAYPNFGNYCSTLTALNKGKQPEAFEQLHTVLDTLLLKNKLNYQQLLANTAELFYQNILHQQASLNWAVSSGNFVFTLRNGKPCIVANGVTLRGKFFNDSTVISGTSGVYYLFSGVWQGKGGKVTWQRLRFAPDSIYAQLNNYSINTKTPEFSADSAQLFLAKWFKTPVYGKFEEKCSPNNKANKSDYPKFTAYSQTLLIKNIFKNVNYFGKYAIHGNVYFAQKSDSLNAYVNFYKNDTLRLHTEAAEYRIEPDGEIYGSNSSAAFYVQNDSIYHPNLSVRYKNSGQVVEVFTPPGSLNKAAFFDGYHSTDIDCDILLWNMTKNTIEFKMNPGGNDPTAMFLSQRFFSPADYRTIQGQSSYHPLEKLRQFADAYPNRTFSAYDYASSLGFKVENVRDVLIELGNNGYIFYNPATQKITVLGKTYHAVAAHDDKTDYDIIRVYSKVARGKNAEIYFNSSELKLYGVAEMEFSRRHQIKVQPRSQEVTLLQNFDMKFSGRVLAGPLDFYGKGFNFKYDDYQIYLDKVDSLKFRVLTGRLKNDNTPETVDIPTIMQDITGFVQIDKPDNKSGLKKIAEFPFFKTTSNAFVYYDLPTIRKKAYQRDKFFFNVFPFTIDSLDLVNLTRGLEFPGKLISGGIFPDIEETLKLQTDTIFGLVANTPEAGYPTYNKANFKGKITLSRRGLMGDGLLHYQQADASSKGFVFTLDTAFATTVQTFEMPNHNIATQGFCAIKAKDAGFFWYPYRDNMYVTTKQKTAEMFDENLVFSGKILYSPNGARANGAIQYGKDRFSSKNFLLKQRSFSADTSDFAIASIKENVLAIDAEKFSSNVDLAAKKAEFYSPKLQDIQLPYNSLTTKTNQLFWNVATKQWTLGVRDSSKTQEIYVATAKELEGLSFESDYAVLRLDEKNQLEAAGVKRIIVADANIIPNEARFVVGESMQMSRLEQAEITLKNDTAYHYIYDAVVDISSGKKYFASGKYDYLNKNLKKTQKISFNSITVNTDGITTATGVVEEADAFLLNSGFLFKGSATMIASKAGLQFSGVVQLVNMPVSLQAQNLRINGFVNPKFPFLELQNFIGAAGDTLRVGVFRNSDTYTLYPLVFGKPNSRADLPIIEAKGVILYDSLRNEYLIGSRQRVFDKKETTNLISINGNDVELVAKGVLDFGYEKEKMKLKMAGTLRYNVLQEKPSIENATALIKYTLTDELKRKTNALLLDYSYSMLAVKPSNSVFLSNLRYLLPEKELENIAATIKTENEVPIENKLLDYTFVLSELNLEYDRVSGNFGNKTDFDLYNANNTVLNRKLPAVFEIADNARRKQCSVLLNLKRTAEDYMLFTYQLGELSCVSSDADFNNVLMASSKKQPKGGNSLGLAPTDLKEEIMLRRQAQ